MTNKETDILMEPYMPFGIHIDEIGGEEQDFSNYYGGVRAVDRTRKLSQLKDYTIVSEIPTGLTQLTFAEIATERAIEIKASTKVKYLLWSGGIDSTVAFYSLVDQGVSFTVIMDEESINEYQLLSEEITTGGFPGVEFIKSTVLKPFAMETLSRNPQAVFITGEIGDQIFGSVLSLDQPIENRLLHYKDVLPEMQWKHLEPTVAVVVDDLATTTVAEWLWAINFTCKYQNVLLRMSHTLELTPIGDSPNVIHFFDTPNFQRWAMQNYKANSSFVVDTDYKMVAKKYIFGLNGDVLYRDNKLKIGSLRDATFRIPGKYIKVDREVEIRKLHPNMIIM